MHYEPEERHLLPAELLDQVERFGVVFERFGFQRMAGRIFALMLLREEPLVTQAELAEELNASTGSISTMIRLLEQLGFVDRISLSGVRGDHFRLTDDPLVEMTFRRLNGAREVIDIIAAARQTPELGPVADERLAKAQDFYVFFIEYATRALAEWRDLPGPETNR